MKTNKTMISSFFTFSLLLFTSVAAFAAKPPVELPPFAFAGRIVDYAHVAYDGDTVVEIRVKAQDGTLLAKTETATYGGTAFNYAVNIPVSSQAISQHVMPNTPVVFEFVDPDGLVYTGIVPQGDATVGNPGQYKKLDVILASDKDKDGVPDEYVDTLEYLMWLNGVETYDAKADYDGDGANNYAEYVAGSNPFDKTDKFSVRQMATEKGYDDYVAMKILVTQGRSYAVETTGQLGKDVTEWAKTAFSVNDPTAALRQNLSTGPSETGYRVIYVKKDGPQRFWQLKVE